LSKYVMRVALLFHPLAPVWLPWLLSHWSHWSGSRTVPWHLVLRLLASAELQLYRTSLPAWSSREPSDLSGLNQDDSLGLLQDVYWALSRNP
jgi:hypothetical protein